MPTGLSETRVCVTGGLGRIGLAFIRLAAKEPGIKLRVLIRPGSTPPRIPAEWLHGYINNKDSAQRLIAGQDVLVHLAWRGSPLSTESYAAGLRNSLLPSMHLLDAAKQHGTLRIVFTSSGGALYSGLKDAAPHREDDNCSPNSVYGIQKLTLEHYLRDICNSGCASARILRLSTAYGWEAREEDKQGFIAVALKAAMHGKPVRIIGDPENVRDFIHRNDAARAILFAAIKPMNMGEVEVFNIGSGVGTTVRNAIKAIEDRLGIQANTNREYWEAERCLQRHTVLDISRAAQQLNWKPEIDLPNGIQMCIDEHACSSNRA